MAVMVFVPGRLSVALYNTWMNGYPVSVFRTSSISPKVKQTVTSIRKPEAELTSTELIIAFGKVSDASLISSAMIH